MKLLRYMRTWRFWFSLNYKREQYERYYDWPRRTVHGTQYTVNVGWFWILGLAAFVWWLS